ncbi:S-layer homology domain-containing protein [Patescibacteria group bacterium]|nr:S-layer homology domain-containing protein [Patescibacteria group bacterium]
MKKASYFRHAALYAVIGVSLLTLAVFTGSEYIASQTRALVGVDEPIDVNAVNFKGNPNGNYAGSVWDPAGDNTQKALAHQGIVVFYKWNKPGYGDYYQTANMGASTTLYKTVHSSEVVHCANGATVEGPHNAHLAYSPSIYGMYDGPGHYWCSMNGTAIDPLPGPENGKMMPDLHNTDPVLRFALPDGSSYHKSASTGAFVQCRAYAGPYTEADATNYHSSGEKGKNIHYHCLSFEGGYFIEPEAAPAPSAPYDTVNFSYSSTTCSAGDASCGGAGTYGTGACSKGTFWCQTADPTIRYCNSNPYCESSHFVAPGPSWTIGVPTNLRIIGVKATGFMLTESVPVTADFAATGTGIPYGQATLTVQIAQDTSFATAWTRPSGTGYVTAIGDTVNSYINDFPATGTFYWRAKMSLGTQESAWTSSPYGSFVVCAAGKTWDGTSCVITTTATCALGLTLNDNKTLYNKGDFVNYTYSCTPAGTRAASVTVQVVSPDGTATTYNTGTNIDTSTMGFSTSNLPVGIYTLRACLSAACTSGVASVSFTIGAATATGSCNYDGACNNGETVALCPSDCGSATTTCDGDSVCEPPETASNCPYDCVSATTSVCGNGTCESGETLATCPADCSTGTTTTVAVTSGQCSIGSICTSSSWCNNGRQCYYPDGNLTCVSWQSSCPTGTKYCSPSDTNCIEPGTYGSLDGWCKDGMECFDGNKKYCQAYSNSPMTMSTCPAGMKLCSPNDSNCIEPGEYGPDNGWCRDSMECFVDGKKFCQPWTRGAGGMMDQTTCPAGSKLCSPNDYNCIEPGATGSLDGWCKDSMECYSTNGKVKYCQAWDHSATATMAGAAMNPMTCPADYPNMCRPDDSNCIELGKTGPANGWCAGGSKQCYVDNGVYCAAWNGECPSGSSVCRSGDTNCVEPGKYGSNDGWCGGSNVAPCYKNDGSGMYCATFDNTGMWAWETAKCPTGTSRCRADDTYCLELGETGPSNSWCANGMSQWNDDGTVTCVSSSVFMTGAVTEQATTAVAVEEKEVCIQVLTPAYNPATNKCKTYSTPCNIPEGWEKLGTKKLCVDGAVSDAKQIEDSADAILATLKGDKEYMKDLLYQLYKVDSAVDGAVETENLLNKSLEAVKQIEKLAKDFKKNKKYIQEQLQVLHQKTMTDIETGMTKLRSYIKFALIEEEVEMDIAMYEDELRYADRKSDFYDELAGSVGQLKGLLKAAKNQRGEGMDRLLSQIKAAREKLSALVFDQREGQKNEFVENTIDKFVESLEKFQDAVDDNTARFTLNLLGKYERLVGDLENLYAKDPYNPDVMNMVDRGLELRDTLASKLSSGTPDSGKDIGDMLAERFSSALVDKIVNTVVDKLTDKMTVMLNEKMQDLAVKIAELTTVTTEKVAQSLSNLTAVAEAQRDKIVEAKNNILENVKKAEGLLAKAKLQTLASQKLKEVMDLSSTINWCGEKAESVQSKMNSMASALGALKLEAGDINTLKAEVEALASGNDEECYTVGASNFRDTPMHEWYFEPAQFNSNSGYIRGYADAKGNSTGNFGPADSTLRIEALAMSMRIFDVPVGSSEALTVDVHGVPEWGIPYVNGLAARGADFDPNIAWNQPITRAEAAELFAVAGSDYISLPSAVTYADDYSDYNSFAGNKVQTLAVDALTELEVFQGYQGNFNPHNPLLRSEFATVNMRLVNNLGLE